MPKTKISGKTTQVGKAAWKRKIALSAKDTAWLLARNGTVLTTSGTFGIEAISILDGKPLWSIAKGRHSNVEPSPMWDRVFAPKPWDRSPGGYLVVDCQSGKKLDSFASGDQVRCFPMAIEGKQAVALQHTIVRMEDQKALFDIPGRHGWISEAFGDQVLWRSKDDIDDAKSAWVFTKLERKGSRELWRAPYLDLGEFFKGYQDGICIFYDAVAKKRPFPGLKTEAWSVEVRAVQVKDEKRILWSHVIRDASMLERTGYPDLLRQGDIMLHRHEVHGELAKGAYDLAPFFGLTAQDIHTGRVVWSKSIGRAYPLVEGDGRFWILVEPEYLADQRHVIALDAQTGQELVSIPVESGETYCCAVEHQGVLALLVGKTLYGYALPKS